MDLLISISEIILAAGPYFIFGGMGSGTQSGKLLFKQICAGDSSICVTETADEITIDSCVKGGGKIPIDSCEIAWGTGIGMTSGFACVDNTAYVNAITGVSSFGTLTFSSGWGVTPSNCNSLIISGYHVDNLNYCGINSNIIGSGKSKISKSCESDIIGGKLSVIENSKKSSIISGISSLLSCGCYSSLISSCQDCLNRSKTSVIISGQGNSIDCASCKNSPTNYGLTIISSICSSIKSSESKFGNLNTYNSILSSSESCIIHCNPGEEETAKCYFGGNSIISSCKSCICGACCTSDLGGGGNWTVGSDNSLILSSCNSEIFDACRSSIISGSNNKISVCLFGKSNQLIESSILNSTIISGQKNSILTEQATDKGKAPIFICNSGFISTKGVTFSLGANVEKIASQISVISSNDLILCKNCSCNSSIISSKSTQPHILSNTINSAILNSVFTSSSSGIKDSSSGTQSINTAILNSEDSGIAYSENSVILTGTSNFICNSKQSTILSGCCNTIRSTDNSVILAGRKNQIIPVVPKPGVGLKRGNSVIAGGYSNLISSQNSLILAGLSNSVAGYESVSIVGHCNKISYEISSSSVIGGYKNCVSNHNSVIIGGQNNCINGSSQSVIIGSYNKGLTAFSNTLYVSKLIFDYRPYLSYAGNYKVGCTMTLISPWTFSVSRGLIID